MVAKSKCISCVIFILMIILDTHIFLFQLSYSLTNDKRDRA